MEEIKLDYQWLLKKIADTGGFTCNFDGVEPESGYVVSVPEFELRVSKNLMCKGILEQYARMLYELTGKFYYIGCWYNSDDRLYYLDANNVFTNKWLAIQAGQEFKQLAIWDISGKCEIRIPKG